MITTIGILGLLGYFLARLNADQAMHVFFDIILLSFIKSLINKVILYDLSIAHPGDGPGS